MKKYKHNSILGSKLLDLVVILSLAVFPLAGMLTLVDAGSLDGDHMQDASGTDVSVTDQVIRKGWGFITGNGLFAIEDAPINYGITYDEEPFLIVNFANSRQVADGAPASLADCTITRKVIGAGAVQTTSGFKPILRTTDNTGFPAATNYCYTWVAIGKHSSSYSGDNDVTNELQTISKSGTTVTLSDGGGSYIDYNRPGIGVNCLIALQGIFPSPSGDTDTKFIGQMIFFAGNFAPGGWAFCDGQLLQINQYTALFSIVGTIYGGDGRTTFGLPDMRGRAAVHEGTGPGLDPVALGQKFY